MQHQADSQPPTKLARSAGPSGGEGASGDTDLANDRLLDLLEIWDDDHLRGRELPAESLALDDPGLLQRLKFEIEKRKRLHAFLKLSPDSPLVAPHAEFAPEHHDKEHNAPARERPAISPAPALPEAVPAMIGRYHVTRVLGQGGFGRVYLAHDPELDRDVAIKVPIAGRAAHFLDIEAYLREARILARLAHPNIVPVYDVGRTAGGQVYVVSKYMEGGDLAARLRRGRPSFTESGALVAVLCDALHYTHTQDLFHRDIKPANILLDAAGAPSLADFGLALKDENVRQGAGHVGTAAYMSPEQARGEGHLVDGRSDIFSIGIVMYELLTGRRPFRGGSQYEVIEQIKTAEPRPPRQIDDAIPSELERICLKALSKRASERYTTARDPANDLRHFLKRAATVPTHDDALPMPAAVMVPAGAVPGNPPAPPSKPSDSSMRSVKIVPRGLCSFDEADAEFFLELLPGPRDRDGLPDVLRFWKSRIEATDQDRTFRVGLIYGPSGCGKSSLVKAGLLTRLGRNVVSVYVEATAGQTGDRLVRGLAKRFPDLPAGSDLIGSLAMLRRGIGLPAGHKALLVLDQFEQWLFSHDGAAGTELIAALRQCDGEHLQALCLVRDDFWMAATRFMKDLEIDLVPDRNVAAVDLFDLKHARKVLAAYGRAYEALPVGSSELSKEQRTFLDEAVAGLAEDGRVVPVRLALFAEMVKDKPWVAATLRELHGMEGVGVRFLDDTFNSTRSSPHHRYHQEAAQAVLKSLLPETNADIKGQMRSAEELKGIAGYGDRPGDFDDLIRVLDTELHLITPVDTAGSIDDDAPALPTSGHFYQLTHDYVVHSLRDWLTRKQRETRRGRAELLLAERSKLWAAKPEHRHLPSAFEWLRVRLLTRRKDWTVPQRRMMARSGRVHGMRLLGLGALLALTGGGIVAQDVYSRSHDLLVDLAKVPVDRKPQILDQLAHYPRWVYLSRLRYLARQPGNDQLAQLGYSLALPDDSDQLIYLYRRVLDAGPAELEVLRDRLLSVVRQVSPAVLTELRNAVKYLDEERSETDRLQDQRAERRARAAATLVRLGHAGEVWHLLQHSPNPRSRSAFIRALNTLGADPANLASELTRMVKDPPTDAPEVSSSGEKNAYLLDPRTSKMRALILALAGYPKEAIDKLGLPQRGALVATLTELYCSDRDAGIHSAAELALQRWKQLDRPALGPGDSPRAGEPIRRRWYVNPEGQTMVLIDGPVTFTMGSPPTEQDRTEFEFLRRSVIPRRFAVASTEVTVEQFQRYANEKRGSPYEFKKKYSPEPDGPMIGVTWFDGATYCNWLSDREGLPHCYEPNQEGRYAEGMRVNVEAVAKGGYRLPTEAEWEYACRAGTVTSRYYGNAPELLGLYEWYIGTSEYRAHPCGRLLPNDLGLFDMLGNVSGWCHDRFAEDKPGSREVIEDIIGYEQVFGDKRNIRCEGWQMVPSYLRSAARFWGGPDLSQADLGLRPARTLP